MTEKVGPLSLTEKVGPLCHVETLDEIGVSRLENDLTKVDWSAALGDTQTNRLSREGEKEKESNVSSIYNLKLKSQ